MTSRTWRTFRDLCEEASVQQDVPKLEKLAKQIAHILDSEVARLKMLYSFTSLVSVWKDS
jgi:hypothetical protein